jgi:hypothetical protein
VSFKTKIGRVKAGRGINREFIFLCFIGGKNLDLK